MTMYFIAAGVVVLLWGMWYYRSLLIDSFGKKSAEREAKIHANINKENKEIDRKSKEKYDEVNKVDPDNLLDSLKKMMKRKEKK